MTDLDLFSQLEASFDVDPIGIIEFAESPKFCNKTLYPRQRLLLKLFFLQDLTEAEDKILDYWIAGGRDGTEIEISPFIREKIAWLKENGYTHFREVVLVGGRRCSKGYLTGISMAKLINDLLRLQNPNKHYGIDADKDIIFSVIAAAQDQAKDQQYADLATTVNGCGSMQESIHKMQELEFSVMTEEDKRKKARWKQAGRRVERDVATVRGKALPANARTIRGSATMAYCFDEFAHFQQGENDQSDTEVYAAAIPSLAQFGADALIFCNSSPYSKVGKFFERYEEGMKVNEEEDGPADPTVLSVRFPSWALFEGWWEDPEYVANPEAPKKCITVSPDWDPEKKNEDGSYFYTKADRLEILNERRLELADPIKYRVERRGHFAEVVDAYLDPTMVDRMFSGRPIWVPDTDSLDYRPFNSNWEDATYQYVYRGHLDPSSTTAGFGFALGHTEVFDLNGQMENHVVFDILKRWNPKDFKDNVIDWDPILEEVLLYCSFFRPRSLTFDQHQNQWPMQWLSKQLKARGIGETRVFQKTADIQRNWNRAEVFRTSLYQGLVHAPHDTADCDYASLELKYLQEIQTARVPRVEKQDVGPVQTKDVADCVMEVTEALIGSQFDQRDELANLPMAIGAGFQPGGGNRATPSELAGWYGGAGRRKGEQSMGRMNSREIGRDPSRRAFGGRPVPRALPQRRLPDR